MLIGSCLHRSHTNVFVSENPGILNSWGQDFRIQKTLAYSILESKSSDPGFLLAGFEDQKNARKRKKRSQRPGILDPVNAECKNRFLKIFYYYYFESVCASRIPGSGF
jgi:hypothetical protein